MPSRSSNKVYSSNALERWFERLAHPWEKAFSESELAEGRQLYRGGEIRGLELGDSDAVVHMKLEKQEVYACIEWHNGNPEIRASHRDRGLGRALAAAGLYEIEELVADEVSAVAPESSDESASNPAEPLSSAPDPEPPEPEQPGRGLIVKLTMVTRGLQLEVFWDDPFRSSVPALCNGKSNHQLTSEEREKLIRLTTRAHHASFQYRSKRRDYLLDDLTRIPRFVREELPQWRRHFIVQSDGKLPLLAEGVQDVRVEATAHQNNGRFELGLNLWLGKHRLDGALSGLLLRNPERCHLSPEHGLVRTTPEQGELLTQWREIFSGRLEGVYPRYMLFAIFAQNTIPLHTSEELEVWRRELQALPEDFDDRRWPAFLRPYQARGAEWMARLLERGCHALLADEMGLGKTVQLLALLHGGLPKEARDKPHLIVCPASVIAVWERECRRFYPKTPIAILKRGSDFPSNGEAQIWLASYTQLRRHKSLLDGMTFGCAVLDEAQFIKNPEAKVSIACMAIRSHARIALTGTPLENRHQDLWTLFRFLMPGLLGGRRPLEERLASDPEETDRRLRQQIAPFVLRRTKAEVLRELPPKVEDELACPLTAVQAAEYRRISRRGIQSLGNRLDENMRRRSISFFTLLTRLRQVCCDPDLLPWVNAGIEESGKLVVLRQRLRDILASDRKVVVFSQFVSFLDRTETMLRDALHDVPIHRLTGKTIDREKPVRAFQEEKGRAVILVSLRAGGTGITLHAADYVFLMDPWWNPAVEAQAIDRVHRIGQERTVFVYRMVTRGTVEERIERLKRDKRALFQELVGSLGGDRDWVRQFESLEDLIALDSDNGEDKGES